MLFTTKLPDVQFSPSMDNKTIAKQDGKKHFLLTQGENRPPENYTNETYSHVTNAERSQVGTGILEHLLRHSEVTCSDVIAMGGLDSVVRECRSNDLQVLRHCAG